MGRVVGLRGRCNLGEEGRAESGVVKRGADGGFEDFVERHNLLAGVR